MILRMVLLFSVIIIALIFKYYIFKYQYFKENILEGNSDKISTINNVSNVPTIDLITKIENQILDLNNAITLEIEKLKSNTLTKEQNDASVFKLAGLLKKLISEYEELDKAFTLLLGERTTDINIQINGLNAAKNEQNNTNAQIQAMTDAENKTITITQTAKNYAKTALNSLNDSITAMQNGDIRTATDAYTKTQNAYNSIIHSESDMRNNVTVASSDTANTMLRLFNTYKNNAKIYMDNTKSAPDIATSVDVIIKANIEAKNAYAGLTDSVSKSINAANSRESQFYVNKATEMYNSIKTASVKSKQALPRATNIPSVNNLPKIENFTIIEGNAPQLDVETQKFVADGQNALNQATAGYNDKVSQEKAKISARDAKLKAIADAALEDNKQVTTINSFIKVPVTSGLIMQYQMNKNDGSSVLNKVNGRYDLNSRQNIHLSATLRNNQSKLEDGILDSTTGYAGISSGYTFGHIFTLCFWFQYKGPGNSGVIYMSNWSNYSYNNQYAVRVLLTDQNGQSTGIGVQYLVNGQDITKNQIRTSTRLQINTWYHVAIVVNINRNEIDRTKIYINGNSDRPKTNTFFHHFFFHILHGAIRLDLMYDIQIYSTFLRMFSSINLIYIAVLPEEHPSKIYLDLLLAYNRELSDAEIKQIYNIQPLSSNNTSSIACKGSYGQSIIELHRPHTCTDPNQPACVGFEENVRWGSCKTTSVNMKAVNKCARSFWDHTDNTDPVKCPYFQPYCEGHVGGVRFGQCYSWSNMPEEYK